MDNYPDALGRPAGDFPDEPEPEGPEPEGPEPEGPEPEGPEPEDPEPEGPEPEGPYSEEFGPLEPEGPGPEGPYSSDEYEANLPEENLDSEIQSQQGPGGSENKPPSPGAQKL